MISQIKQIGKHSLIYTISNFLTKAAGLILIPVYTRYLSTSDYGIIANVVALINFFTILFTFGMESAWGRLYFDYEDKSKDQKELFGNIFLFLTTFGLLVSVLLTLFGSDLFNLIIPDLDFNPFIIMGIWTSFFGVFFMLKRTLFRVRNQSAQFGLFSLGRFLVTLFLIIVAVVFLNQGALGKVGAELLVWFIFMVIAIILLRKDVTLKFNLAKQKDSLKYAISVLPHSLAGAIVNVVDRVFITNFVGMAVTGVFAIGFQFGSIMYLITYSINLAWSPFFMRTAKELGEKAKTVFAQLTTYYLIFILFCGLALSFFSRELVLGLTTKDYYGAVDIIPIYIFTFIINGLYFMISVKIFYVKKAVKFIALATISSAIVNIALNAWLIPELGMIGAAWSRFISAIILFGVAYHISQRFYYIHYERAKMLKLIIITGFLLMIFLLSKGFEGQSILLAFGIKLVLLSGYAVLAYFFNLISASQIKTLLLLFKRS